MCLSQNLYKGTRLRAATKRGQGVGERARLAYRYSVYIRASARLCEPVKALLPSIPEEHEACVDDADHANDHEDDDWIHEEAPLRSERLL
jgi:hypothetical protein